ncbi:MAG: hypothetical protein ACJ762_04240 [Solirubrobacteraceae bacterium]
MTVRNGLVRIARAWRALDADQRRAVLAALALLLTMFLPWYEVKVISDGKLVGDHISAFGDVSFIEAAIFLVSVGVLLLLFFRAEQRAFHLPGGDGTVIFAAGAWAAFLLFWRVFDRPDAGTADRTTVGIQWGFFLAFIAAGVLTYMGFRLRTAHAAEPTRAQDPTTRVEPTPPTARREITYTNQRRRRKPAGPDAPTQIAGQLSFEEEPRDDPTERQR